jgi:N6-adenosine-specific RNA methylase IME4
MEEFVIVGGRRFPLGSTENEATALGAMIHFKVPRAVVCVDGPSGPVPSRPLDPEFLEPYPPRWPQGRFPVVYADPAWAYRKAPLVNRGRARAVEKEYATMQPEEIAALPVGDLAAPDAVLFLWATGPKLPLALDVMKAWDFEFRTVAFVWVKLTSKGDKPHFGMGFYTRANAELCLVGTRGKGVRRQDASVRQVCLDVYDGPSEEQVATPIGAHSAKPDEIRQRIERLYAGPRVELFARERVRDWTVWGNEV